MIQGAQIHMPEPVRDMVEEGLKKTQSSWNAISSSLTEAAVVQATATKAVGEQVLQNMTVNFDATLDAAHALTNAKTLSEVQSIQVNFVHGYMTRMMTQFNEWVNLSMKVHEDAAEVVSTMATAVTETVKR
jgi:hypothetical protein